jgi:rhodanese-related sulfurtransferase
VTTDVPEIDIDALQGHVDAGAALIDVREPDEYADGHVPGAVLVPLQTVPDELARIPADQAVFVICHSGARSARATQFLRGKGIDATNVAGGTKAWIEAGKPVVRGDEQR